MRYLKKHFPRLTQRFYLLNGYNDHSLKNTYVASLPQEIQLELNKMAIASQKDFTTLSLGQIHQMTLEVVDKLCRLHKCMYNIINNKANYSRSPIYKPNAKIITTHVTPRIN